MIDITITLMPGEQARVLDSARAAVLDQERATVQDCQQTAVQHRQREGGLFYRLKICLITFFVSDMLNILFLNMSSYFLNIFFSF